MIEENNATTIEGLKDEIELLTASNGKLNHTVQDLETLNASFREENQRKTNEIQDLGANFDEKLRLASVKQDIPSLVMKRLKISTFQFKFC